MATRFEVVLHGKNPSSLRAAGEEALNEIERLDKQLNLYNPDSEIAYINARDAVYSYGTAAEPSRTDGWTPRQCAAVNTGKGGAANESSRPVPLRRHPL